MRSIEVGRSKSLNKETAKHSDGNKMNVSSNPLSSSPSDLIFPTELNYNLRLQNNNLTAENGALRRSLQEKENALERAFSSSGVWLPPGSHSLSHTFGVGRASELAASKIVELSKRVRELTAELEAEKRRGKEKRGPDGDCGREGEDVGEKIGSRKTKCKKQETPLDQEDEDSERVNMAEVKTLREKLSATSTKLSEWRNQCQMLKQELKLADKILASEIGDGATLETIKASIGGGGQSQSGNPPWRGRAQQLALLRAKVAELNEKLKKTEANGQGGLNGAGETEEKENSKRKAAEQERLETSLQEAERQTSEMKKKLEVSKARSAAKQAEIESFKNRLSTTLAKAENDDQLITTLKDCLKDKESIIKDKESEIKAIAEENKRVREDLMIQLMKEKARVNYLEEALDTKKRMVKQLQKAAEVSLVVGSDTRETMSMEYGTSASTNLRSSDRELRIMSKAIEAERLRLTELVAVLNKRLTEEQSQTDKALKNLKIEKRKNAILETKVASLELESATGRINSYNKNSARKNSSNIKPSVPDDIKHRLEFLEVEKIVLQSRIECLQQEKEEDLKNYSRILCEIREIFRTHLGESNQINNQTIMTS